METPAIAGAKSSVDAAYERLRAAILQGELPPGSRISQVQAAAEFDISRGPLREALRLLERDGLIEARANHMVRVAPVSMLDLDQLYAMRVVNESFALRLTALTMHPDRAAAIQDSLAALEHDIEANSGSNAEALHRAFHMHLYSGAEDRLFRTIGNLVDDAQRYRTIFSHEEPDYLSLGRPEHRAIADAAVVGDAVQAGALLARHLGRTALTLFANIASDHEPSLVREAIRFVSAASSSTGREPSKPRPVASVPNGSPR
jgi:DNA-binding GntR family transcriptional regulator